MTLTLLLLSLLLWVPVLNHFKRTNKDIPKYISVCELLSEVAFALRGPHKKFCFFFSTIYIYISIYIYIYIYIYLTY